MLWFQKSLAGNLGISWHTATFVFSFYYFNQVDACPSKILLPQKATKIAHNQRIRTAFPKLFLNIAPLNNLLTLKRPLDKNAKANLLSISDNHNLKRRLTLVRRMRLVQFRQLFDIGFDRKSSRFAMSRPFLLLSRNAVTVLNPRSTKYELGNAMKNFLPDSTRKDISL